jgi:hypothetical protein
MFTVKTYTTRTTEEEVAEGLNGQDVRESVETFEEVEEVVDFLTSNGLTAPSSWPLYAFNSIWLGSADTYLNGLQGWREDTTAHPGDDFPADVWFSIVERVAGP